MPTNRIESFSEIRWLAFNEDNVQIRETAPKSINIFTNDTTALDIDVSNSTQLIADLFDTTGTVDITASNLLTTSYPLQVSISTNGSRFQDRSELPWADFNIRLDSADIYAAASLIEVGKVEYLGAGGMKN